MAWSGKLTLRAGGKTDGETVRKEWHSCNREGYGGIVKQAVEVNGLLVDVCGYLLPEMERIASSYSTPSIHLF